MTNTISDENDLEAMRGVIYAGAADDFYDALKTIARGRKDNGRPFSRDKSQDIARRALVAAGVNW